MIEALLDGLERPASSEVERTHVLLTRIQALVAERMVRAKRSKPCFCLGCQADVTELLGSRHGLFKFLHVKITSNTFLIKALVVAAKAHPLVLARRVPSRRAGQADSGLLRIAERINVGFAVNAPQGLVVAVIQDADEKTLAEIAQAERTLIAKARSNKLTLEDVQGQTIALSNLGAYSTDSFIGIVPPATSAILTAGNVAKTVVPQDGNFAVRKMITLHLTADRMVLDEVYAARFLGAIRELLERPQQLV